MESFNELPALGWSGMPRRLLNILALLLAVRFGLFLYNGWRIRMRFRRLQAEGIVSAHTLLVTVSADGKETDLS